MKTPRILMMAAMTIFTIAQWSMAGPQREVVIKVNGMFCPFCMFGIKKCLKKLPKRPLYASIRTLVNAQQRITSGLCSVLP